MNVKPKTLLQHARAQGKVDRIDSRIEATLAQQLRAEHFPPWTRNHLFMAPERKFELDFCWAEHKFAIEVEGEVHRIKARFHEDIRKHWYAMRAGWTVLRLDGRVIRSGEGVKWAKEMIERVGWNGR